MQGFPDSFPGGSDCKESCLQWGRPRLDPWVGKIPWRLAWQPTPVFLPGESDGQSSLAGYTLQGRKESDSTEWLSTHIDEKKNPQPCKFKELP